MNVAFWIDEKLYVITLYKSDHGALKSSNMVTHNRPILYQQKLLIILTSLPTNAFITMSYQKLFAQTRIKIKLLTKSQ